ncbi:MAG: transglycosylase domain-containing protein [Clostridia bacterium]|nr:transglycosylase domain-containing protein [Clostridia bacterium]
MAKNSEKKKLPDPETQGKEVKGKKKKRRKKKHPILFGIFLFFFSIFVAGMLTAIIVGGTVLEEIDNMVYGDIAIDLDTYKNSQNQTSIMYAYDSDGTVIELTRLHGEENRIWLSYEEMPEEICWAFICLEDKRFYEHPGVDWIRTAGVMINPAYEGQGASTITQQLIKNLTDDDEVTYSRKFNEILRALNLENNYSKKDILEAYLNTVSLGAGCYGVKTAAETYFDKEVSELTISECATIAGITKAPYSLNPYANYEECMNRRDLCLWYMHDQGKITDEEYAEALEEVIVIQSLEDSDDEEEKENESAEGESSEADPEEDEKEANEIYSWYEEYVIDQVIKDLQKKYGYEYTEAWRMVYYGGLNIYSAVDLEVQEALEKVYLNRSGFPKANYDERGQLPQSSMTIMDYQGRIVALVGATGEKTENRSYNRATDNRAKRQPGSSIKPLAVYAPAVDLGLVTANSTVLEKAIIVNGKEWPRNFNGDHGSGNYVTVENALARSLNTVPVRILDGMLGVKTSIRYCNDKFHINLVDAAPPSGDRDLSPLAVGGTTTGVTTLEMAGAFATFGNGGRYYEPYSYFKVTDRNGNIVLDRTNEIPQQSIKRETASSMLSMLTTAVTQSYGTAYGSQIYDKNGNRLQTFAKTGTTSDNCDKWYCGGTPYYVASVWYGYDYRADLHTGSTNPAKTIFKYVFDIIHEDLESKSFSDVSAQVDSSIEQIESQQGI